MKSSPTKIRDLDLKILDIKALRALTRLLGKFRLPSLYHVSKDIGYENFCKSMGFTPVESKLWIKSYGLGLQDSKLWVERMYHYEILRWPPN